MSQADKQLDAQGDMQSTVASPCVGVCCPDERDICMGCLRTMEEITRWWEMNDDEKRALLKILPSRRVQF